MSYSTLILGDSGTGKTCSLRNLDPKKVLLIQPTRKPLPFRSAGWSERCPQNPNGNIFVCSRADLIVSAMFKTTASIIIVDDFQYILANQFMARRMERSYDKFNDIGGAGFDVAKASSDLALNKRVYVLAHTQTDEFGKIRIKTLGKMLDDKIVLEGMFTTVLRTHVENGVYTFSTQNNGSDTVKSPMGMFKDLQIDNDLEEVDKTICEYYGIDRNQVFIPHPGQQPQPVQQFQQFAPAQSFQPVQQPMRQPPIQQSFPQQPTQLVQPIRPNMPNFGAPGFNNQTNF